METRIDKVVGGTSGKVLFVNLTEQSARVETVPSGDYEKYLGSRGMAARYYRELIASETDPLLLKTG